MLWLFFFFTCHEYFVPFRTATTRCLHLVKERPGHAAGFRQCCSMTSLFGWSLERLTRYPSWNSSWNVSPLSVEELLPTQDGGAPWCSPAASKHELLGEMSNSMLFRGIPGQIRLAARCGDAAYRVVLRP